MNIYLHFKSFFFLFHTSTVATFHFHFSESYQPSATVEKLGVCSSPARRWTTFQIQRAVLLQDGDRPVAEL